MVVLVGYSVAGVHIVVTVSRVYGLWSAVGGCCCLGNRVLWQVGATTVAGQAATRGTFVSGAQRERYY